MVYVYTTDPVSQYNYIKAANDKGYDVLLMDGQLDSHFIGLLENKIEKSRFVRVDSDVTDNLIPKEDKKAADLTPEQRDILTTLFRSRIPKVDKAEFLVNFEALSANADPVMITQNEYMRRMKDMAAMQPGMSFYGELPDSYNLIVNTESPVIATIKESALSALSASVAPLAAEITSGNEQIAGLRKNAKDGKLSDDEQKQVTELEASVDKARKEQEKVISDYAQTQPVVKQVIDLALLGNGLLKGADLTEFIHRSIQLLK